MNIEQATAVLDGMVDKACYYPNRENDALDMAIEALREKAEREKGCAFCNTGAHRILQNALYCPRCGKRLEVNNG